jgi:integrase
MAKIKFYTRSKDEDSPASVYMRYTDNDGVNEIIRTDFKMVPRYWNAKKQTFRDDILTSGVIDEEDLLDMDAKFTELKDFILRASYKLSGPVTLKWLKDTMEDFGRDETPQDETLMDYLKRYIKEARNGDRFATVNGLKRIYSKETVRSFTGLQTALELFFKETHREYDFNDINLRFYDEFVKFYYDRKCSPNYVGRLIKTLKTIMRAAFDEDKHTNQQQEKKSFRAMSVKIDKIYLTPQEIKQIADLDLSDNKHYEEVRDIFLVGCYTAQRYGDFSKLNESNIIEEKGKKYIKINNQNKTRTEVIIPISGELNAILKKYDYKLPKSHPQKVNAAIKKIGEKAGINSDIYLDEYEGSKPVTRHYKKFEKISTHCCRRSGITNMVHAKIPLHQIMLISGHATEKEFMKYVRTTKMENAEELSKHEYFSQLRVAK